MTRPEDGSADVVERLLNLLVYAPLGMVWERDDVLAQLSRRGRSQAQLAKLIAQMAAQQGPEQVEQRIEEALTNAAKGLAGPLARLVVELGVALGPPGGSGTRTTSTGAAEPATEPASPDAPEPPAEDHDLPITDYDQYKARDLLPLLTALTPDEREQIRVYEAAHRARRTVLARLEP